MSIADYSLTMFVALNVARALAYWPQIVSIYRDPGSASAVSLWTWTVFTAANVATAIYALAALGDFVVAAVFGVNAIGCATIVVCTAYKRFYHRRAIWKNISAGLLLKSDCHSALCECVPIAAAPEKARAGVLRFFARWRAARSAARQRYIHDIAKKGLAAID
jgi:hypothetical protein